MKKWLCLSLITIAFGCSSNKGSTANGSESLSSALTKHVKFTNGTLKKGDLPPSDKSGEKLTLAPDQSVLKLSPGGAMIMALEVMNPDQHDTPVAATMMQFEGSDSHVEVPAGDAKVSDAGSGEPNVRIENPFEVDDDICKSLCKGKLTSTIEITVKLKNGGVCKHETRAVELDCSKDGDPKQCTGDGAGNPKSDAGARDAGSRDAGDLDAGKSAGTGGKASSSGSGGKGAASGTGGTGTGGATGGASAMSDEDAGPALPAPQIAALDPASVTAGDPVLLTIEGSGFLASAVVYVDGDPAATAFVSETALTASVPASATVDSGNLAVYVENTEGDIRTRSNVLYLRIDPAPGAPVIYDYSPDNGVPGDTIEIIASNLSGQTLTITDVNGKKLTPGAIGTISWPNASVPETVQITLPDTIATGPITVANGLGSFKGKIFTVGNNLTRAAGTMLSSSSQYNESNWSRASGGDNLLSTSFFGNHGDCASMSACTTKPFFMITFAEAQTVARIAMRGNREYASGYDFLSGKFEVLDAKGGVLWEGTYDLPEPDRDLDVVLPAPVANALSVRFSSVSDESDEPGFSELEVFGP